MERLPAFRDFYPEPMPHPEARSCDARQFIFQTWRDTARRYGFREYDGPPLEPLELYTLKSGAEIVDQLYNFQDKGGRDIALRPEMTPTLARMVAAHERAYRKPIKWFALPQLFRYERQQKGRLREHFQFNADIFGEKSPAVDAELIALLIDTLRAFGLTEKDFVIRLSSRQAWEEFFVAHGGTAEKQYEFFQIIDKLEREAPAVSEQKLQSFGLSLEAVQRFIAEAKPTEALGQVLQNLQDRGLSDYVQIDYNVIRGLAYYTGTVFEAFARHVKFRAIAGGGRYDNLVKLISGGKVDLPAIGFGMGDVVLYDLLADLKLLPVFRAGARVFFLIETETLRSQSLRAIQLLREAGVAVDYSLEPLKADKQFKRAMEGGAVCTVSLEAGGEGVRVRIKNLADRTESFLDLTGLVEAVQAAARLA